MATKSEVLNDATYGQYIMIGAIQVARDVVAEANSVSNSHLRKKYAREILQNPSRSIDIFKSLVIVDIDVTNWATFTETDKITGAKQRIAAVFNEAVGISG